MSRVRLNKRTIDTLHCEDVRGVRYFDTDMKGFYIRIYPNNRKVFGILYGPKGRQRQMTVGTYGVLTVEQARSRAAELLAMVTMGRDPAAESAVRRATPTIKEWVADYLKLVTPLKKSVAEDERYLGWAAEFWGQTIVSDLTVDQIQGRFDLVAKERGKVSANRWLASLRACLSEAWRRGYIDVNQAKRIRPLPEPPPRDRVLSDGEMERFLGALKAEPNPVTRTAIYLLLETGARESEVVRAQWSDFKLEDRLWRLPSPKSGKPQVIPLTDHLVELLKGLKKESLYFMPGKQEGTHKTRVAFYFQVKKIFEAAEITGVTVHDIRRTFGLAVARTAGLHVASKLLRHSDIRVTEQVYAPLGIDTLREASEKVAEARGKLIALKPAISKKATLAPLTNKD